MGLKLLRWVYDLGVSQERTRIARLLENEMAQRAFSNDVRFEMLNESKMAPGRKDRLKYTMDVSAEVSEIVSKLFKFDYDNQPSVSLMFPEEKKR